MKIIDHIEKFHGSIKKAKADLVKFQHEINDKQAAIKKSVESLNQNFKSGIKFDSETGLKAMCAEKINSFSKDLNDWVKTVEKYMAGKEFINKFEKTLLIIVFANVKAGKSTLGNFISGYYFKGTPLEKYYTGPQFYTYDWSNHKKSSDDEKSIAEGCFKEDCIEATNTIQYFTLLDGLTWVDTPGIHSLTRENEELAKKYVQFADLVLFLTPSTDPAKADEIKEMEQLVRNEKPMLVTITKSDEGLMQIVNGKAVRILKGKNTRSIQEKYLSDTIEKNGILSSIHDKKYISISVMLANESFKSSDEKLFEESNIHKFYDQIGSVASENSIELKKRRPRNEVNALIREIIEAVPENEGFNGVFKIKKDIQNLLELTSQKKEEIKNLYGEVMLSLDGSVGNAAAQKIMTMRNSGQEISSETASKVVSEVANSIIIDIVMKKITKLIEDYQHVGKIDLGFNICARVEDKFQTIEYEKLEVNTVSRNPRNLIEFVGHHVFGVEYTENKVSSRTIKKTFKVGDNMNEVISSVIDQAREQLKPQIEKLLLKVNEEYFGPIESHLKTISKSLGNIEKELKNLNY